MNADNIKIVFTYGIATIMIVGGLAIIYLTRLDPPEADVQGLRLLMAGFIGGATQFVFNRETQTQTARQVERGISQGTSAQPTVTTTAGPPQRTTVTPAEPVAVDA